MGLKNGRIRDTSSVNKLLKTIENLFKNLNPCDCCPLSNQNNGVFTKSRKILRSGNVDFHINISVKTINNAKLFGL
jgi:hypothetical protein